MKGMATCVVCGRDFALMAEDHYTARDTEKKGVIPAISGQEEAGQYDAFDCPHCGCQNVMQERKATLFEESECPCDFGICDECNHPGEGMQEGPKMHDGCVGCRYEECGEDDKPCVLCKQRYVDRWEAKDE